MNTALWIIAGCQVVRCILFMLSELRTAKVVNKMLDAAPSVLSLVTGSLIANATPRPRRKRSAPSDTQVAAVRPTVSAPAVSDPAAP